MKLLVLRYISSEHNCRKQVNQLEKADCIYSECGGFYHKLMEYDQKGWNLHLTHLALKQILG